MRIGCDGHDLRGQRLAANNSCSSSQSLCLRRLEVDSRFLDNNTPSACSGLCCVNNRCSAADDGGNSDGKRRRLHRTGQGDGTVCFARAKANAPDGDISGRY